MAVTYTNNWKNILTALKSKIMAEMKCPVFSNFDETNKSNQFIRLIPTGSDQGENQQFQDYVLNQVSILEALVHDNPTISLADSTTAYNVMIGDLDLAVEPEDEYEDYFVAGWDFSCEHLSNLG